MNTPTDTPYLPKHVLDDIIIDQVEYRARGLLGRRVKIPFKRNPTKIDIGWIAQHFAQFVSQHLGEQQIDKDISLMPDGTNEGFIQYLIIAKPVRESDAILQKPNYRVFESVAYKDKCELQPAIVIKQDRQSRHDKKTLDSYVQKLRTL